MKFARRLSPTATVDLVPMIDVVFQLVVFFMVSSTFIKTPGIALEFPASSTSESVVMSSLVVTVISQDEVYINKDEYTFSSFQTALAGIPDSQKKEIKSIVLEGGKNIPYDLLVRTLDTLRNAGFTGVNLRTVPEVP